ncbi:LysR family transcriptional regulator [Pseudorhodoferax sp. Leaf267]|uniref:LysR family transcriptional regulator n=1 Tax=Pseudorhodoferax sp. Leaf267 TaxID=1736316 RepID=UPI0006F57ED2|nr:LysR family transcriptional regulator [Pseudorhodoferax sp. Leaf267]KQP22813.1 LysR family transcriptional regulator [Pseudorhodoferax sp. Leaf267]
MQLNALRYFAMVAATGSFAATARHFQVPASSVSRFISALERELGQQLLYRNTRSVRLTETGARYVAQVREALDALDLATEQAAGKDSAVRGLIRINAPVALGRLHVAQIIHKLQAAYPELTAELTLTDAFIDPVQEGVDITVRIGTLPDSGLIARKVGDQNTVLCASPAYLRQHGTPATPQDLERHSCLVYKGQSGAQRWFFRRTKDDAPLIVRAEGPLRSNNAEVLVAAALAGRGIVLFPTWIFERESFRGRKLVRLLPQWMGTVDVQPAEIHLVSPENRLRSLKVRTVLDFMLKTIGSPPYWDAL